MKWLWIALIAGCASQPTYTLKVERQLEQPHTTVSVTINLSQEK